MRKGQVTQDYLRCLDAPNYTVFSNTTSAAQWNDDVTKSGRPGATVKSVEGPHNGIHLAVGGFEIPGQQDQSPIDGANGDMGENETAAFDPFFFFHHCFIDLVFWRWQQRHGATDELDIIAGYEGSSSSDAQGPTPGIEPNTPLGLGTPLYPFTKADGTPYTSADCINLEAKFGVTYDPGSLKDLPAPATPPTGADSKVIAVSGINRGNIAGSFLVSAFGTTGGQRVHLGTEAFLSRWNVADCANCQTHLEVKAFFDVPPETAGLMPGVTKGMLANTSSYTVEVRTHDSVIRPNEPVIALVPKTQLSQAGNQPDFRFEVR